MAVEEQTSYDTGAGVKGLYARRGQRLTIAPDRWVTKLGFWLQKVGSPTGNVYFRIRRVSDEAILLEKLWGDAASVPAIVTYEEVTFDTPQEINAEAHITVDFANGSSEDHILAFYQNSDVKAAEYMAGYYDSPGVLWFYHPPYDYAYRYTWDPPPPPLVIATTPAAGIIYNLAILTSELTDDGGLACDVRFQWGKTDAYGNDTPWQAGNLTGDIITQEIGGLLENTLYHFRAQGKNAGGTVSGYDLTFRTAKASMGKGYALSRGLHIKRVMDVLEEASIAASAITALVDCKGVNLIEAPSSLTLTVEATYDAVATQGIKIHVRTSLTNYAFGMHTGADGAAALTDAEAHFVVNELVGLTIKNLTDGSSALITANTLNTVTATLAGGTDNDWDGDDIYIIEGAGYDTEDWDSWTPAFSAGSSIRQTKHYDVDPVYLKVFVENLDAGKAVTDVKAITAVGT
ncbi:hypothetical protein ES703_99737 [subsurface metagenome]